MDRMALYDVNHAIENEMYTRHHFDWSHPNGIPIGVMNIRVMSTGKYPMPIALKLYSIVVSTTTTMMIILVSGAGWSKVWKKINKIKTIEK